MGQLTKKRVLFFGLTGCLVVVLVLSAKSMGGGGNHPPSSWARYDSYRYPVSLYVPPETTCSDTSRTFNFVSCHKNEGPGTAIQSNEIDIVVQPMFKSRPDDALQVKVGTRNYPGYLWIEEYQGTAQQVWVTYLAGSQQWNLFIMAGSSYTSKSADRLNKTVQTILANIDHG